MHQQGVAALGDRLDAVQVKRVEVDAVPAEAVADHVVFHVQPLAVRVFPVEGRFARGVRQDIRLAGEDLRKAAQVLGGRVHAARADDVNRVGRRLLLGGGGVIGAHDGGTVKVVLHGLGVRHAERAGDLLMDEIGERHAADALDHDLREREAVVAVHRECARVGLERLRGEVGEQGVMRLRIRVVKQEAVAVGAAHQAGGVVEQHTHGNILIPLVRHRELRDVVGDRAVQIDLALIDQPHHGGGGEHLAGRADAEQVFRGQQAVFLLAVYAADAAFHDLAAVHHRVLDAGDAGARIEQQLHALVHRKCGLGLRLCAARERVGTVAVRRRADRGQRRRHERLGRQRGGECSARQDERRRKRTGEQAGQGVVHRDAPSFCCGIIFRR